jgi:hypothetical protein
MHRCTGTGARSPPPFLFIMMRTFAFGRPPERCNAKATMRDVLSRRYAARPRLVEQFIREDRFEIDGADAAADFLSRQGYSDKKIAVIWDALPPYHRHIAASAQIAQVRSRHRRRCRSAFAPDAGMEIISPNFRLGFKKAMLGDGCGGPAQATTGVVNPQIGRKQEHLPISTSSTSACIQSR